MKTITLNKGERIIAVVPQRAFGPGWINSVTWVYIIDMNGSIRTECIQPEDRSTQLNVLFDIGSVIAGDLIDSVPTRSEP